MHILQHRPRSYLQQRLLLKNGLKLGRLHAIEEQTLSCKPNYCRMRYEAQCEAQCVLHIKVYSSVARGARVLLASG